MENEKFAMELIKDARVNAKRWFIISMVELMIIIGGFIGFLIYESQYETVAGTETTTVDGGNGVATYLENSESGDINYGKNNQN